MVYCTAHAFQAMLMRSGSCRGGGSEYVASMASAKTVSEVGTNTRYRSASVHQPWYLKIYLSPGRMSFVVQGIKRALKSL